MHRSRAACARLAAKGWIAQRMREMRDQHVVIVGERGGMRGATTPSMLMPSVKRFMTREPYSVASTESLARARHLMTVHGIRHLPVIDSSQLVGIIADRDVATIEAIPGIDLAYLEVSRVMSKPLRVWGETPLDEVSNLMMRLKADCVIVQGGQGVQGIFTSSDALGALTELLRRATA
jgi:CBS domain-containing protein